MSKRVYDLKNDDELNTAYWEAVRGGIGGAARVSATDLVRSSILLSVSYFTLISL